MSVARPSRGTRRLEIVEYTPAHADALATFVRAVWDPRATPESVEAGRAQTVRDNPAAADGRIPTVLALLDGRAVAHITSVPERLAFRGVERTVAFNVGFHVLPEHRNGPLGVMVAKEMLRVAPASMCVVVADAPLRIFAALGWRHLGSVPNQLRVLDPGALAHRINPGHVGGGKGRAAVLAVLQRLGIARLGAHAGAAVLNAWAVAAPRARVETRVVDDWAQWGGQHEADALWRTCAPHIEASLVRDGARLRWRFAAQPERYVMVEARERSALVGWLVLTRPPATGDARVGGLRVSAIVDLLYPTHRIGVAGSLVHAAVGYLRAHGVAEAVLASTPHSPTQSLLRRTGFLGIGANLNILVHPHALPSSEPNFASWWYARGDGDADQSF